MSKEHVKHATEKLEVNRVAEVVKTLPLQSKIVLSSVLVLNREEAVPQFIFNINTSSLWRHFGVGFCEFKSVHMNDYITK